MSDVPSVCGCGHVVSVHDRDGCTTIGCECESVTWHLEMPPSVSWTVAEELSESPEVHAPRGGVAYVDPPESLTVEPNDEDRG